MNLSLRLCAVCALAGLALGKVPLPDRRTNLESREEFRMRTRRVFKEAKEEIASGHRSFEQSGVLSDDTHTVKASVFYDSAAGKYYLQEGATDKYDGSLAKAAFVDAANESGWGRLSIIGSPEAGADTEEQHRVFYGVGYLEGYLTCDYIATFYKNYYTNTFEDAPPSEELLKFINENDVWVRAMVLDKGETDPYWRHVGNVLQQFDGLVTGYNAGCGESRGPMGALEFRFMNMNGDLFDIKARFPTKTEEKKTEDAGENDDGKLDDEPFIPTHCSALIKVMPDFSDAFVAHATWDTYSNIFPRIYKHVSVPVARHNSVNKLELLQHRVHYSSMPGYLASVDDFYITKGTSDLSLIETSISLYNKELLKEITPQSVLCWMRVMVSNALARDGKDWTDTFTLYNSGTYNNEWMVTDFSKFQPGEPPSQGFFHVLNQLPGHVVTEDFTQRITNDLYYGSYNVPVHEKTWELAGYAQKSAKSTDPAQFSYYECPRALQFKRLHKDVATDADMGWIIGWNDIPSDEKELERRQLSALLNGGDDVFDDVYDADYPFTPSNAISARCDLISSVSGKNEKRMAYGGIDGKVASYSSIMIDTPVQWARAGPTFDEQPVFCWEGELANSTVHEAHPECYDWEWQPMRAHDIFYRH